MPSAVGFVFLKGTLRHPTFPCLSDQARCLSPASSPTRSHCPVFICSLVIGLCIPCVSDFPRGSVVKNLPTNARDASLIPGLGRSPGEGNGNPLQYPCLGNPLDRGAWRATVLGVEKSWTQLSTHAPFISAQFHTKHCFQNSWRFFFFFWFCLSCSNCLKIPST